MIKVEEKQKLYLNLHRKMLEWRWYTVEEKQKLYLNVNTLKNLLNTQKLKRNKSCI